MSRSVGWDDMGTAGRVGRHMVSFVQRGERILIISFGTIFLMLAWRFL
jgi:hypothetical protein